MAVRHGYGKIAGADALVFAYDTGDTRNSYKGEPTVNLLYSAGAYNLINGATDIYANVTRTDLGNGKYRFVNDGTGGTTVRVYANEADLIDGETYAVSVYYEDLIGTVSIDWCDQAVTGNNSSTEPSGRLTGTSSRSSYTSPFYFLDINLTTGGSVTLYNPQVEHKSHVTPFVAGTRSSTQGLLDLTGNRTIELANVSFNSSAQPEFDGSDDLIAFGGSANIVNKSYTIEAVFNRYSANRVDGIIGDTQYHWFSFYVTSNNQIYFFHRRNSPYTDNGAISATGVVGTGYYHAVGVFDINAGMRVYLNGNLVASNSNTTAFDLSGRGPQYIGQHRGGAPSSPTVMSGQIPVLKIYEGKALTAAEVKNNYNNYKGRFNI